MGQRGQPSPSGCSAEREDEAAPWARPLCPAYRDRSHYSPIQGVNYIKIVSHLLHGPDNIHLYMILHQNLHNFFLTIFDELKQTMKLGSLKFKF